MGRPLLELSEPQNFAWLVGRCSAPGLSRKCWGKRSRVGFSTDEQEDYKDNEDDADDKDEDENKDEIK